MHYLDQNIIRYKKKWGGYLEEVAHLRGRRTENLRYVSLLPWSTKVYLSQCVDLQIY